MKSFKTIIKNVLLSAAVTSMSLATVSCDDLLDTKPQGTFTDKQIGDDEATDLMVSAYATLLCHYFGNNESFAGPINNWVFDVRSDDALKGGDGVTMDTKALQAAIDDCASHGGGRVTLAEGRFLSGMIRLKDGVELRIVSRNQPAPAAVPVQTTLEDLYLFHFADELGSDNSRTAGGKQK